MIDRVLLIYKITLSQCLQHIFKDGTVVSGPSLKYVIRFLRVCVPESYPVGKTAPVFVIRQTFLSIR